MLSTHVLDTSTGRPAAGIPIALFHITGNARRPHGSSVTNADGRTDAPLASSLAPGIYELVFSVGTYFAEHQVPAFFDEITIRFRVDEPGGKFHVPLLLAPWGYSTYRGS